MADARRVKAMLRARRMDPENAPLMDVLFLAYRAEEDPAAVAAWLVEQGIEAPMLRRALTALVLSHAIGSLSAWPADLRAALDAQTA